MFETRHENYKKKDLIIDNSSIYKLELELIVHPGKEADIHRLYAESIAEVNRLQLSVDIITAEIMEDIISHSEKSIPPSARSEVRRSQVPLNPHYKNAVALLNKALANRQYFFGLTKAMSSKGHRLTELVNLAVRFQYDKLFVGNDYDNKKPKTDYDKLSSSDGMDLKE